jgi:acyl-CoA synthetase (AMP-forming)/AMP-acid ligase II
VPLTGVELELGTSSDPRECRVRGPHMFQGYLDPDDTAAVFEGGWFRTGDLLDIHDGRVSVVGRIKEIAIRNGQNISLDEVDEAIRGLSGVVECASFRLPDKQTGERVAVALVVGDGDAPDLATIQAHMRAGGLAPVKWPEQVVIWSGPLPRTATGKVRREELATDAPLMPTELAPRLTEQTH